MKAWIVKLSCGEPVEQQERLWAETEEVRSAGEEFKVPLFWKSGSRRSRGDSRTTWM